MNNFTDMPQASPINPQFQKSITSTSGTEFFFINTAYLDAYVQLLEGVRQHRGLLVLTGEAGVGKTSLLRKLINESPAKIKFVYCYTTNLDFENLLAVICDQLGATTGEGKLSDKLEALNHCLNNYFIRGIDVAFLIDDAHRLNENTLNSLLGLSPLEFEGTHSIQLVLSGMPVLEEILSQMQALHASLASAVHVRLEPLATEEVAAFITRQMRNADDSATNSLFPLPVIARINNYTGGIPRLINMLCERALLLAKMKGRATVSIEIMDEAAAELMLKDKQIAVSTMPNFFCLEATQTGSAMQVARMEQLLAQSENLASDETKTLVVGPLPIEQPEEYPAFVSQEDDRESGKKRSNRLNSTGLQIGLLLLLALLAGLLGGMGSVYWYRRTITEGEPRLPVSTPADGTTAQPVPDDKLEPPTTARPAPMSSPSNSEILAKPDARLPEKPLEPSPASSVVAEPVSPAALIEPPSPPPSPTTVTPDASLVSSYLMNGDLWLERGDVASARLFYQEAANAGSVQAMVAVGKTYDPVILKQQEIRGFRPDPVKAAEWYLKASKAGDSESAERLGELRRWLADSPALEESEASALRQLLH